MPQFTAHIEFTADNEDDALIAGEQITHVANTVANVNYDTWDVSGTELRSGAQDWSIIVPRLVSA